MDFKLIVLLCFFPEGVILEILKFPDPLSAIEASVLQLDLDHFHFSLKVSARFDKELNKTLFSPLDNENVFLSRAGNKDLGKSVLIDKTNGSEPFTVLKLDERDEQNKTFWIFTALLRDPVVDGPPEKLIEILNVRKVIEWGKFTPKIQVGGRNLTAKKKAALIAQYPDVESALQSEVLKVKLSAFPQVVQKYDNESQKTSYTHGAEGTILRRIGGKDLNKNVIVEKKSDAGDGNGNFTVLKLDKNDKEIKTYRILSATVRYPSANDKDQVQIQVKNVSKIIEWRKFALSNSQTNTKTMLRLSFAKTTPKPVPKGRSFAKTVPKGRSFGPPKVEKASFVDAESAIESEALGLNKSQSVSPRVIQKYDTELNRTVYSLLGDEGKIVTRRIGNTDLMRNVVVSQSNGSEKGLNYIVLKLDDSDKENKTYWIFTAAIRDPVTTDPPSNKIIVGNLSKVIQWGMFNTSLVEMATTTTPKPVKKVQISSVIRPRPKPKEKVSTVSFPTVELGVEFEALKLDSGYFKALRTPLVVQNFDEKTQRMTYTLSTDDKKILVRTISKKDLHKEIIIERSENGEFTVLKADENDQDHKLYWIFTAVVRNAVGSDPPSKSILIKSVRQIVEWGEFDTTKVATLKFQMKGRSISMKKSPEAPPVVSPTKGKFARTESALISEAFKLDETHFDPKTTPRVVQNFDKDSRRTVYTLFGEETKIILRRIGRKDVGQSVVVERQGGGKEEEDLVESAVVTGGKGQGRKTFVVMKLDKSDTEKKRYWIFTAVVRIPTPSDPPVKQLSIKDSLRVVEWGIFDPHHWKMEVPTTTTAKPRSKGRSFGLGRSMSSGGGGGAGEEKKAEEDKVEDMSPMVLDDLIEARRKEELKEDNEEEAVETVYQKFRLKKQKELHPAMYGGGELNEPAESPEFKSNQEIYSHVRWYTDFKEDTKIELDNVFAGHSYGVCAAKILKPGTLTQFRAAFDVVNFFATLLREYCKAGIIEVYNQLFTDLYLTLNHDRSISIKSRAKILSTRHPTIAEQDQLQRLFTISAYSQVYTSLVNFPTEPLTPDQHSMGSRGFILLNTALLIQDMLLKLAPIHFKMVVHNLIINYKTFTRKILCEFVTYPANTPLQKKKRKFKKYSAIAMCVLLEFLVESLKLYLYFNIYSSVCDI